MEFNEARESCPQCGGYAMSESEVEREKSLRSKYEKLRSLAKKVVLCFSRDNEFNLPAYRRTVGANCN